MSYLFLPQSYSEMRYEHSSNTDKNEVLSMEKILINCNPYSLNLDKRFCLLLLQTQCTRNDINCSLLSETYKNECCFHSKFKLCKPSVFSRTL